MQSHFSLGQQLAAPIPHVADMAGTWWVVQCRPQRERALRDELRSKEINCFMPTVQVRRKPFGGSPRTVERVLFPLYLFLKGDHGDRYEAARSRHTSLIIEVKNQAKLTRELIAIESEIGSNPTMETPANILVGDRCRIRNGHPFAGLEGFLERRCDSRKVFILDVEALNRRMPVEVDECFIERVA